MIAAGRLHQAWQNLPLGGLDDIIGAGVCLILAPHPDDETLGCGGLIAACVAAHRPPLVVILTDGAGSHPASRRYPAPRLAALRAAEAQEATRALGLPPKRLMFLNAPDGAAPHDGPDFADLTARLVAVVRAEPACTAILAPWRHDPHSDHEAAALLAAAIAHQAGICHRAYPVWGWALPPNDPVPASAGVRFDITPHRAHKCAAIRAHRSQHGKLITDDPDGFALPEALLAVFERPWETFLEP